MILRKTTILLMIGLWSLYGCQTIGERERPPAQPQSGEKVAAPSGEIPLSLEAKGAMGFIRLLEERAGKIHSFRARIVLSVSGREIPSYEKLPGLLIASLPGRYRVTAYSPGKRVVVDFLTLPGSTFLRWAPLGNDNLSMEAEVRRRPGPKFMDNLSLVMGAGPFPQPGIALENRVGKTLVLYLLEQHSAGGLLTRKRKLLLSGREVLVTRIEEIGFRDLLGKFDMTDYRLIDSHWIPHRLLLTYQDLLSMEINLKSISLNDITDERLFEPKVSPTGPHSTM